MTGQMLYSPAEAAKLLSLSRALLYELLASGEIRSLKIGRLRRIRADELEAFIERQLA